MRRKWYGVYAENGLGVYSDYSKLLDNSKYTRGEHVRKFDTREEAKEYIIDGFSLLHGVDSLMETVPDFNKIRLNFFYFKKTAQRPPNTEKSKRCNMNKNSNN